jgi:hypothetical protein
MSHDELRAEYERLRAQIVPLLQNQPQSEAESSEAWPLLEKLQVLTQESEKGDGYLSGIRTPAGGVRSSTRSW